MNATETEHKSLGQRLWSVLTKEYKLLGLDSGERLLFYVMGTSLVFAAAPIVANHIGYGNKAEAGRVWREYHLIKMNHDLTEAVKFADTNADGVLDKDELAGLDRRLKLAITEYTAKTGETR